MDGTLLSLIIISVLIALPIWGLYHLIKYAVKQALREFAKENS